MPARRRAIAPLGGWTGANAVIPQRIHPPTQRKKARGLLRGLCALIQMVASPRLYAAAAAFFCGAWMCGLTAATMASNAATSLIASSLRILRFSVTPLAARAGMKRL